MDDELEPLEDDRPRLVRFALGDQELLVDVASVLEVLVAGPVTRLPGSAPAIAGVTSVRGRIVPVVDASRALGTTVPVTRDRFLVVATPDGPVALVVDRVDAVVAAEVELVADLPERDDGATADGVPPAPLVVATATIDGASFPVVDPAAVIAAAVGVATAAAGSA